MRRSRWSCGRKGWVLLIIRPAPPGHSKTGAGTWNWKSLVSLQAILATAIFLGAYAIIFAGEKSPRKLDRPAVGLLGGLLMVLGGVLTREEALRAIDFGTLALLFGMMVVIHYAAVSGLLDRLGHWTLDRAQSPTRLLWTVCLASGVLSALFVNDTICLLLTPLLLNTARRSRVPPEPLLLGLATSSNVGSVMTLTGNPQNMLIGQFSGWGWAPFALRMVPLGLLCLLLNAAFLAYFYRKQLAAPTPATELPAEPPVPWNRKLATRTLIVLGGLLLLFLSGMPLDLAALTAAGVLVVWANRPPEEAFASVDWTLLLFFAGLFVVVEGVTKTQGAGIARLLPLVTAHAGSLPQLGVFSVASVAGSNLFSNVPFVMLLHGWLTHLPHARLLWLTLAMSSTFAGNLTLVGSVANLIVAQQARETCPLTAWDFFKVGLPATLLTTGVGVLVLWLYSLLGWV